MEKREWGALKVEVRRRYELMAPYLNEQLRRVWAAAEALTLGRGGNAIVAEAIGVSRTTLTKAKHEVLSSSEVPSRQRRPGGGRKFVAETEEGLLDALDALIDPSTRGDPESPLRWTCKSTYQLAAAVSEQGHPISQRTVYRLLEALGYSLQANRKTQEGAEHPDRDAQFLFIYRQVQRYQRKKLPVISVETKKNRDRGKSRDFPPPTPPGIGVRTTAVRLSYMFGRDAHLGNPSASKYAVGSAICTPGVWQTRHGPLALQAVVVARASATPRRISSAWRRLYTCHCFHGTPRSRRRIQLSRSRKTAGVSPWP